MPARRWSGARGEGDPDRIGEWELECVEEPERLAPRPTWSPTPGRPVMLTARNRGLVC